MFPSSLGIFSGAGSLSSSTPKHCAREFVAFSFKFSELQPVPLLQPQQPHPRTFRIILEGVIEEVLSGSILFNLTVAGHSVQQLTIVKINVLHDDTHLPTLIHGFFLADHKQLI
jgi:hypothetical protein